MSDNQTFNSAFKSWKIWLAVFLALFFAGFMLFRSLNETHFVCAEHGSGTHNWKDYNGNKKVDLSLPEEFHKVKNGAYRIKTNSEFLQEIQWSGKAFFFLFLALLFMIGRDLAYMWRIKILTKDKLTWKSSFFVIMLWEFASAVSPGIVGGSAVAMFILKKEKIPLGRATAIVVVTAMMDNLFYVLMIPLIFIFISPSDLFPDSTNYAKSVESIFWIGFAIILCVCLLLFLSIFYFPKLIRNFLSFLFKLPFLKKFRAQAVQIPKLLVCIKI